MSSATHRKSRYRLQQRLASGGMAELYRAEMIGPFGFKKTVAIKKMLPYFSNNKDYKRMFYNEGRIMASMSHRNLVQVFDMFDEDGELYICMEYIDGCNLDTIIKHCQDSGELLRVPLAIWIGHELCRGLAYVHRLTDREGRQLRVVHRDVKPLNVLCSTQGEIKLIDFGIAESQIEKTILKPGQTMGSFHYFSPEQARGEKADPASDQYAVGLILYELLSGKRYNQAEEKPLILLEAANPKWRSVRSLNLDVSNRLERCIRRSLSVKPKKRYASVTLFADELRDILQQEYYIPSSSEIVEMVTDLGPATLEKQDGVSTEPCIVRSDQSESSKPKTGCISSMQTVPYLTLHDKQSPPSLKKSWTRIFCKRSVSSIVNTMIALVVSGFIVFFLFILSLAR